ncbi:cutinase [Colletotrichum gloeosporioides Cg-14]|uniref:Cutinase n=1 Tax=Colletotrichum gloeosporioides (strain Cg-14) TaxID=1237896 RepID=T0KS22_COLGC|nr:cutinase [Colletotrichum gloeosporioides Cg-14]
MWFSVGLALLVGQALATPHSLQKRQGNDCPPIHIFGARETTAPPGFGAAAKIVDDLTKANQGATNEAINYPACGGGTDCLGVSYADSVKNGTDSVATAINDFNKRCPQTKIVMLGFSQGAQIMDNAYCGGGDSIEGVKNTNVLISQQALGAVKVAIFMGDPRYVAGLPYEVGTCQTKGVSGSNLSHFTDQHDQFAPRPQGFQCPFGNNIKSFCDSADPFCCNGNDPVAHLQYPNIYGDQIRQFVSDKLK